MRLQCCLSPLSSSGSPLVIESQSRGSDGSPQQASQKTSVAERDGSDQWGLDERLGKILPSPLLGMSVDKVISAPIHVVKAKRATSAFSPVVRTPGWMESTSIQTLCRLSKPTSRSRKFKLARVGPGLGFPEPRLHNNLFRSTIWPPDRHKLEMWFYDKELRQQNNFICRK